MIALCRILNYFSCIWVWGRQAPSLLNRKIPKLQYFQKKFSWLPDRMHCMKGAQISRFQTFVAMLAQYTWIFHNENPHRISRAGDFFLSFQLYISQSFNRAWVRGLQMEGTKSLAWVFYYFMSMSLSPPFIISWNNNKSHKITTTRIHFFSMMNFSFRFLLSWWISFSFYIS